MDKEIIWSPKAEADYLNDLEYLEQNHGRKAATRYMEELTQALENISRTELVNYQLVDAERGIRRYRINKNKNLYYRIESEAIQIIAFYMGAQNS